ncbi:Hypothetical protein SCF082_LOCUS34776 [Durusdinium trenchii]|uniref:SGNH hydrolase-type esterase domain-containing protein n=1 Tax=Durusdinium trenchii TaxID=1381693 RepID=A0ABP0P1V3_9DINO
MEVCQDLLGLSRGACNNCDCPGFLRHVHRTELETAACPAYPVCSPTFRCARCSCLSKFHAVASTLGPDTAVDTSAPVASTGGTRGGQWKVGDLVQVESSQRWALLLQTPSDECVVELLGEEGSQVSYPSTSLTREEDGPWSPPEIISDFEKEENFKDLVFQPEALRPLIPALKRRRCKISVLGGSISLQSRGYRPNLLRALERRGVVVDDLAAAVGTAGSRALALVVNDLVTTKQPDLLIIEVAVNDGDDLLESTTKHGRPQHARPVLAAAEGLVRTVRRACPQTAIIFLEMFLRDDAAARVLKTGSEAWKDSSVDEAIGWYHEVAPRLHRHLCRSYGLCQIDLVPAFRSLSLDDRQKWFRDDCHHSDAGGEAVGNLLARLILWSVRQPAATCAASTASMQRLPPPLDTHCWCNGKTIRILPGWCSNYTLRRDKDLLRLGQQSDWLLLHAGRAALSQSTDNSVAMTMDRTLCNRRTNRRRVRIWARSSMSLSQRLFGNYI